MQTVNWRGQVLPRRQSVLTTRTLAGRVQTQTVEYTPHRNPLRSTVGSLPSTPQQGGAILDPFLGSGSSRIAAYDMGLDFIGYELDAEYYRQQEERFNAHSAQGNLFLQDGLF